MFKEGRKMAKALHTAAQHEDKMCALTCCPHDLPLKQIGQLAKNAKYICKSCGSVAADKANLCKPQAIA